MAERVKRRVAAARLAVAFVAATTIAGATAWAQAGPPPPQAESSAVDVFSKYKIDSGDIKNGSLLFQDFKAGEVLSTDVFVKYKKAITDFKLDVKGDIRTIKGELGDITTSVDTVKGEVSAIKGELGSYIKGEQADARYLKLSDAVVRGSGSVFTATKFADGKTLVPLLSVPGLISVEALPGGTDIRVTNVGSSALAHSQCGGFQGAGTLQPNQSVTCDITVETDVMQLIDVDSSETATLNFTFFPAIEGNSGLYTVQILVGL
jgi:hypothetical protein